MFLVRVSVTVELKFCAFDVALWIAWFLTASNARLLSKGWAMGAIEYFRKICCEVVFCWIDTADWARPNEFDSPAVPVPQFRDELSLMLSKFSTESLVLSIVPTIRPPDVLILDIVDPYKALCGSCDCLDWKIFVLLFLNFEVAFVIWLWCSIPPLLEPLPWLLEF